MEVGGESGVATERVSAWFRAMAFVALVGCGDERVAIGQSALDLRTSSVDASVDAQEALEAESHAALTASTGAAGVSRRPLLDPIEPETEVGTWELRLAALGSDEGKTLTYDSGRNRTVLFSALSAGISQPGQTWEWDGLVWKRVSSIGPSIGGGHSAAYDGARKRTVLHKYPDTWWWDGWTWRNFDATPPPSRQTRAMAYDSARERVVLYGGWSFCGSFSVCFDLDTWEWDGESWEQVATTGPSGRSGHAMAYDSRRGKTVLFGSLNRLQTDTWEWDGVSWEQAATTGPPGRSGHAMAYDSVRGRTVLFGGRDSESKLLDDLWEWDGLHWIQVEAPGPSARVEHVMAYDSARGRVVLFGGRTSDDQVLKDTWEYHTLGRACSCPGGGNCASTECSSGYCVDGVCCESSSLASTSPPNCASCARCDAPSSPGVCTPVVNARDPDSCTGTRICGPHSNCGPANGQPCTPGVTLCASGHCADGYCCDAACDGECERCNHGNLGWLNEPNGSCMLVPPGYPATPSCGAYSCTGLTSTCTATTCISDLYCAWGHYCDSTGKCSPMKEQGSVCNTSAGADCLVSGCRACTTGYCVDGYCCDEPCVGACAVCNTTPGTCEVVAAGSPGAPSCAPFTCDGVSASCSASCVDDSECAKRAFCDSDTGVCTAELDLGDQCSRDAQCRSGFCVDGVCCNSTCKGQCSACNAQNTVGTCAPIVGEPRGSRPACPSDGESVCATTLCDGKNGNECAGFVGSSERCREASCTDGIETLSASCNGNGSCPFAQTKKCEPYVCAGDACGKARCESDADCAPKFRCAVPKGKTEKDCVPLEVATCDGHIVTAPDGRSTTDCSPYKCEPNGSCKLGCGSIDDCAAPNVCDLDGRCIAPSELTVAEAPGCGCRTAPSSSGTSWRWGGLVSLAAFACRRRNRRHRLSSSTD